MVDLLRAFVSTWVLVLCLGGCGSGGGGSGPSEVVLPPGPDTVIGLSLRSDLNLLITGGAPTHLTIQAECLDGSQSTNPPGARLYVSDDDVARVEEVDGQWLLYPQHAGVVTVTATLEGQKASVDIEVWQGIVDFVEHTVVLPVGAQFPMLLGAWVTRQIDGPLVKYWVTEDVAFSSSNPDVAEFKPKVDGLVIDPTRDLAIGHLHAKQLGKTEVTFQFLNYRKTIEVEVLPYHLLTTDENEMDPETGDYRSYGNYDVDIDERGDTYVLHGVVRFEQAYTISKYDRALGKWTMHVDFEVPQQLPYGYGGSPRFAVGKERMAVIWDAEDTVPVLVVDKASMDYEVLIPESVPRIDVLAMDQQDRIMVCWNQTDIASCRVETPGQGWGEIQNLPTVFPLGYPSEPLAKEIQLSDDGRFYLVKRENEGETPSLTAFTMQVTNNGIEQLDQTTVLADDLAESNAQCQVPDVSPSGNFVCTILRNGHTSGNDISGAYSLSYSPTAGWQFYSHVHTDAQFLPIAVSAGINDLGEVLVLWGDSSQHEVFARHYGPQTGWGVPEQVELMARAATPDPNQPPVWTDFGWRTWIYTDHALVTRTEDGWEYDSIPGFAFRDDPFDQSGSIGNPYYDSFEVAPDGTYAMAWRDIWGYTTEDGHHHNRNLYMAIPAQ